MTDTPQQPKKFYDTLTELDGKVLRIMFDIYLNDWLVSPESVMTAIPDAEKKDVLTSIDKIDLVKYIKKVNNDRSGKFIGYTLTEKGDNGITRIVTINQPTPHHRVMMRLADIRRRLFCL